MDFNCKVFLLCFTDNNSSKCVSRIVFMTKMTQKAASRIQSHAAKTGKNIGFAKRAQSAAENNSDSD